MEPDAAPLRRRPPHLTANLPGIGGTLKHVPEDFEVEELPAYEPTGEGEFLFLWVEKRDVPSEQLARHVAKALAVGQHHVGVAGLKDRRAVTRQWVSVPADREGRLADVDGHGIRVLKAIRHGNKLRTGHLRGNRFSILVRDVVPDAFTKAEAIRAVIESRGLPNFYGSQRFGHDEQTLQLGFDLLAGRRSPRELHGSRRKFLLRLSMSAVQSALFNEALMARLDDGLYDRVLAGDVMEVTVSGGKFVAEDPAQEQPRFDARETAITGPIYGPKMRQPQGEVLERELAILSRSQIPPQAFRDYKAVMPGTRRPYRIFPQELEITSEPAGLRFRFALPSGSYATMFLDEFMKSEPAAEG